MNCETCGRRLREDSRYCDYCGTKVPEKMEEKDAYKEVLDVNLLLMGILFSIAVTALIAVFLAGTGVPVFIGGLFLPLFFKKKKIKLY